MSVFCESVPFWMGLSAGTPRSADSPMYVAHFFQAENRKSAVSFLEREQPPNREGLGGYHACPFGEPLQIVKGSGGVPS